MRTRYSEINATSGKAWSRQLICNPALSAGHFPLGSLSNAGVYRIEKALSERTDTDKEFVGVAAKYNLSIKESAEKSKIAEDKADEYCDQKDGK